MGQLPYAFAGLEVEGAQEHLPRLQRNRLPVPARRLGIDAARLARIYIEQIRRGIKSH